MTHFGIITPPVPGHLHPFGALGRELIARGHRVTCIHMPDLQDAVLAEGLEFCAIGSSDHPRGSLPESLRQLGALKGLDAVKFTIRALTRTTEMVCRDGPSAIREVHIEALLVDQMEPAGGAMADHLGLPFVTICNALAINRDDSIPPPFTPWTYRNAWWARLRNRMGYVVSERMTRPIADVVARYREAWNLPRWRSQYDTFSSLGQICQMPRDFDFPRTRLPQTFHYVGPLRRAGPQPAAFPWDRLDGRRVAYASLGTLQNRREPIFRCIAEACRSLDVQLVIAHGGGLTDDEAKNLPGDPIAVRFAPQLDVLKRINVTITHAGLNTVLDSISCGVPVVAIPLTYEQPAIARRIEWTGVGQSIDPDVLAPATLGRTLRDVLDRRRFRAAASRMRDAIATAGGVARAADLIEPLVRCPKES
jgi:MGT family glycosyltransferase